MNARFAVLILFISSTGWGLTWLPLKKLNDMGLDSMQLIFIAFISGALVLSPWLYRQYPQWKYKIRFIILIALAGGFANASFQTAIYHGDVVRVMILFYMLPVWSVIGGKIFLKEKIDARRILAVLLSLSGAFIILDVWNTSWQGITYIDFLAIGSGLGLAATNILFRFTQETPLASKVASIFIGCTVIIGSVLFIQSVFLSAPIKELPSNELAISYAMLYGAIYLVLITLGTQWAVTQMEAGRSAIIIVMELVTAVVSIAILTYVDLKAYEILGGILVVSAALLEGIRDDTVKDVTLTEKQPA